MKSTNNEINKNKLDELVECISLSLEWIISKIPAGEVLNLKKELESREELSDYKITLEGNLAKYNTLVATKNYGVQNA